MSEVESDLQWTYADRCASIFCQIKNLNLQINKHILMVLNEILNFDCPYFISQYKQPPPNLAFQFDQWWHLPFIDFIY